MGPRERLDHVQGYVVRMYALSTFPGLSPQASEHLAIDLGSERRKCGMRDVLYQRRSKRITNICRVLQDPRRIRRAARFVAFGMDNVWDF